jgi:PAB-dependent poly(A)-specific ribonuclease subunit 3
MEPSKILITGRNRIRFSSCGILDLLSYDGGKNVQQFQQEDLINFGQLVVALACGTLAAIHSLAQSIDFIFRSSSADLRRLIQYLLSKPSPTKSIDDVIAIIGPRLLNEINGAHQYVVLGVCKQACSF